jgi:DNA-binding winged helix-turn-helix (wHTH) protein
MSGGGRAHCPLFALDLWPYPLPGCRACSHDGIKEARVSLWLAVGPCRLDLVTRTLEGPLGSARLSPIGVRLIELLAENRERTVQRRELIDRLWDGNALVGDAALNRVVSEVRRAATGVMRQPLVETVHGRGYRIARASVERLPRPSPARRGGPTKIILWAVGFALVVLALSWLLLLANGLIWGLAEKAS